MNALTPIQQPQTVTIGFGTKEGFELIQRMANVFASSQLVPKEYRGNIGNCVIALDMSTRLNASPLMIMQNLYIVHGKPSWSSQFITAAINSTGKFSPLRFRITEPEPEKEVTAEITEYDTGGNKKIRSIKETIRNRSCTAWAVELSTKKELEGPPVTLEMAVKEGWFSKSGSKWKTMPELMLHYRAATFFGRLYAPEVLMGMRTQDEIIDIEGQVVDVTPEPETPKPEKTPLQPLQSISDLPPVVRTTAPAEVKPTPVASPNPRHSDNATNGEVEKLQNQIILTLQERVNPTLFIPALKQVSTFDGKWFASIKQVEKCKDLEWLKWTLKKALEIPIDEPETDREPEPELFDDAIQ